MQWGSFKVLASHIWDTLNTEDLSQNPAETVKRARCSTIDGSLPTLTTNSALLWLRWNRISCIAPLLCQKLIHWIGEPRWSQKKQRPLTGLEMLAVMGLPVTSTLASYASTPQLHVDHLSGNQKAPSMFVGQLSSMSAIFNLTAWQAAMAGNGMDVPCVGFMVIAALWLNLLVKLAWKAKSIINPWNLGIGLPGAEGTRAN